MMIGPTVVIEKGGEKGRGRHAGGELATSARSACDAMLGGTHAPKQQT